MIKKSVAIFAMTSLGISSAQADYFDGVFSDDTETSVGIEGVSGTEYETGVTRVNNASAMNNIMKSLKYLKDNSGGGKFVDGTTATDAVFTGGSVGIGTTTPGAALDVHGTIMSHSSVQVKSDQIYPNVTISSTSDTRSGSLVLGRARGSNGAETAVQNGDGLGNIQFRGHDGTSIAYGGISIDSLATEEWSSTAMGHDLRFSTTPNGSIDAEQRMMITQSGNVGIGTTTPTEKLDVDGNVKATAFIGDGSQLTNLPSNGKFVDGTTATDAVFTGGNVGIGTDSPQALVHINDTDSTIKLLAGKNDNTAPENSLLVANAAGVSNFSGFAATIGGGNTGSAIWRQTDLGGLALKGQASDVTSLTGETADIFISDAGNLGIGTITPNRQIELKRTESTAAGMIRISDESSSAYWDFGHTNDGDGNDFEVWYNDGSVISKNFHIGTSGNIGIGTSTPTEKLEVEGGLKMVYEKTFSSDGNSNVIGWRKIGKVSGAIGTRFEIEILGSRGYGQNNVQSGKTNLYGTIQHNINASRANISGIFYSEGGEPILTEVKFQENGDRQSYDIYGNFKEYSQYGIAVKVSKNGTFTQYNEAATDPGSDSATVIAAKNEFNITNGAVGIGINEPSEKLDVNGNVKATAFIGDGSQLTNLPSNGKFVDGTTATDAVFTGGNVGIGTDSPVEKFQIGSSLNFRPGAAQWINNNIKYNSGSTWEYMNDGGAAQIGFGPDGGIGFATYPTATAGTTLVQATKVLIDSNGNVGIGTSTPTEKLDVNGAIKTKSIRFGNVGFDHSGDFNHIHVTGSLIGRADGVQDLGSGAFRFKNLFLSANAFIDGYVGIGTTTPSEKLDIDGAVKISDTTSTCDADAEGSIKYVKNIVDENGDGTVNGADFQGCVANDDGTFSWKSLTSVIN